MSIIVTDFSVLIMCHMKYIYLFSIVSFVSCAYQQSTHSFVYHGTDAILMNEEFFYVQKGVTGQSKTRYTVRGGGAVREGLVADAKRDLSVSFPLGPNQSYANLSVDIIRTETGRSDLKGRPSINQVTLQCTISADVIQYGSPSSSGVSESPKVKSLDALDKKTSNQITTEREIGNSSTARPARAVKKGDVVELNISGPGNPVWVEGTVDVVSEDDSIVTIMYEAKEGGRQLKTLPLDSVRWRMKK